MLKQRKSLVTAAAGGLFLLFTASFVQAQTSRALSEQVSTKAGLIAGTAGKVAGVTAFKGIPFGAPPVGNLRWKPAQPAVAWQGIRAGDKFGAVCVQPHQANRNPNNRSVDLPDSPPVSEDCLYLNVWTPAKQSNAKLPVMVWIFGGAYTEGAGSSPHNQGDQLAAKGVVVVSMNYRLGAFGFLAHPELTAESPNHASGNYALTDVLMALQWVKDNIAGFGGDASNVTIFGESAGSAIASALVGSPLSKGLFQRAISESGTWMGLSLGAMKSREATEEQTVKAATAMGATNLAALRALSTEAADKLPKQGMIIDGWVIPEELSHTFEAGKQQPVDVLVGSNKDEGSFAAGPPITAQAWKDGAAKRWGDLADKGMTAYPAATDAEATVANGNLFADNMAWIMRFYGARQRAIGKHAFVYHFVWSPIYPEGVRNLGVCHTCEIQYVFNNLNVPRVFPDASSPELAAASPQHQRMADITSSYWINFARTGDPNGKGLPKWPQIETTAGPVLHIGENSAVGDSLGAAKVSLYQGLYEKQVGVKK